MSRCGAPWPWPLLRGAWPESRSTVSGWAIPSSRSPAESFFPELGEDSPGVLAGQYETASLTVSYIPLPARLMLTCAALLRHLPVVAICLATAFLCRQLLRYLPRGKSCHAGPGRGWHRSFPRRRATRNSGIRRHGHVRAQELGLPGPDQSRVRETMTIPFLPFDWPLLATGIFLIVVARAFQMGAIQLGALNARPLMAGMPGTDFPPSNGYPAPIGFPPPAGFPAHRPTSESFPASPATRRRTECHALWTINDHRDPDRITLAATGRAGAH